VSFNIFVGLGANLGNREKNLRSAIKILSSDDKIKIEKTSTVLETKPVDYTDQPYFLNQVIEISTLYEPEDFLNFLKETEIRCGRVKTFSKGPRIIDLDVLLFGNIIYSSPVLTIPHPAIKDRAFVLKHLIELSPDLVDPVSKNKYMDILAGIE